jgi:hypothetical protein
MVEKNNIQVDRPGGIFISAADPAQLCFQRPEDPFFEQKSVFLRDRQHGSVQVVRALSSNRRGFPYRRNPQDGQYLAQERDRQGQVVFWTDIRAQEQADLVAWSFHDRKSFLRTYPKIQEGIPF